ncbi:hypothetical protein ACFLSS_04245 [Bacteroidota bacterium]
MILPDELTTKSNHLSISIEVQNVLQKIVSSIRGPDRVSYLIELLPSISHDDKELLIELFNNLLKVMIKQEASDIELGGFGSEGFVWFRIYGTKEPLPELPKSR